MNAVPLFARDRVLLVWVVLSAAALLSWGYGYGHPGVSIVLLLIAVVKVRFIGTWFMELHGAPRVLSLAFDGWCVVLAVCLAGPYLL